MTGAKQQDVLARARNAYRIGDYENAEKLACQVLEGNHRSYPARILLGMVYARIDRNDEAVAEFERGRDLAPNSVEPLNNLGVMYRRSSRLPEAIEALERAAELAPDRADIAYNLGNIHKMAGNQEEAIAAYQRAIELDPAFVVAYNNLGTIYERRDEYSQAAAVFEDGLGYDANHPTLRYNLGIAYQNLGRLEEAKEQFERALKARPGWTDALNNLGLVLQALKRYDEALNNLQEILTIDERNAVAENNIATVYAQQGNVEEAFAHYAQALERNPGYGRAAENLGHILERKPPDEHTLERLRRLADKGRDNTELQLNVGKVFGERGRYDEAEQYLKSVVTREPDNARARRFSGLLAYRKGEFEEAESQFQHLLQLDPEAEDYRLDVGKIHVERGEHDKALEQIRTFRRSRPRDLNGVLRESEVLRHSGRPQEARKVVQPFKQKYADSAPLLTEMAQVHRDVGDTEAALQSLDELVSLQGKRALPDDLDGLNESLALYEQTAGGAAGEQSLDRLRTLTAGAGAGLPEDREEFQVESTAEQDEASIPVVGWEQPAPAAEDGEPETELQAGENDQAPQEEAEPVGWSGMGTGSPGPEGNGKPYSGLGGYDAKGGETPAERDATEDEASGEPARQDYEDEIGPSLMDMLGPGSFDDVSEIEEPAGSESGTIPASGSQRPPREGEHRAAEPQEIGWEEQSAQTGERPGPEAGPTGEQAERLGPEAGAPGGAPGIDPLLAKPFESPASYPEVAESEYGAFPSRGSEAGELAPPLEQEIPYRPSGGGGSGEPEIEEQVVPGPRDSQTAPSPLESLFGPHAGRSEGEDKAPEARDTLLAEAEEPAADLEPIGRFEPTEELEPVDEVEELEPLVAEEDEESGELEEPDETEGLEEPSRFGELEGPSEPWLKAEPEIEGEGLLPTAAGTGEEASEAGEEPSDAGELAEQPEPLTDTTAEEPRDEFARAEPAAHALEEELTDEPVEWDGEGLEDEATGESELRRRYRAMPGGEDEGPRRKIIRLTYEHQAGMLEYLLNLTQALPEEKRREFRRSEVRLRAEALRNRLRNRPGLRHTAAARREGPPQVAPSEAGLNRAGVVGTLDYIRGLSRSLSDPDLAAGIDARLERIAARLRRSTE